MIPLRIAILWHFHQPYYDKGGELILPWVRLHGIKDYWDLPELFYEYPKIKQTINLVPSLSKQLEDYSTGTVSDMIQRLTKIKAMDLNIEQKQDILRSFFLCNENNMLYPYLRYNELYRRSRNAEEALASFTDQDWLDLQVWYNLTWFGQYSRQSSFVKNMFNKGSQFTEEEKEILMKMQLELLGKINNQMVNLKILGRLELSATPLFHPILPLLCDSRIALESMPDSHMPENIFNFSCDAENQIQGSLDYYENLLGERPQGMWPSEGSLSNEVLNMMIKHGIKWTATDEEVLWKSLKEKVNPLSKYFPWEYNGQYGEISMLFRDHSLSDAIGFTYSNWNPHDAAADFSNRLRSIRNELVGVYGEECLKSAVVPIILDGENCWEFYPENGIHFLRAFFSALSNDNEFKTITFSEATKPEDNNYKKTITSIRAGSWINADFNIWFGHAEHRIAWDLLAQARTEVESAKDSLTSDTIQKAMEEIYIAEGSDWFWWYGDSHSAPNKSDFDVLFRWHLTKIYEILGKTAPEILEYPLGQQTNHSTLVPQKGEVHAQIDGIISSDKEWENAGYFDAKSAMSAMHQIGELLGKFYFAATDQIISFRIDTLHPLTNEDSIVLAFSEPQKFSLIIRNGQFNIESENAISLRSFNFSQKDIIEFSLSKKDFEDNEKENGVHLKLNIKTQTKDGEIIYPRQGTLDLTI